jgi:PPOX class probable F420-dependent enzyme
VPPTATALESLDHSWTVVLTTFKRDGTPVPTPVNLAIEDQRGYFRTYSKAWKTIRIRNQPEVEIAPSTFRGKPTGKSLTATARPLAGDEDAHARAAIGHRHPIFQRFLIPGLHKIARYTTVHYEVRFSDT